MADIAPKRVHDFDIWWNYAPKWVQKMYICDLTFKTIVMSRFERGLGYFIANWGLFIGFGIVFHTLFHLPLGGVPSGFMWLWDAGGWSSVGAVACECILTYVTVGTFIHAYKRW